MNDESILIIQKHIRFNLFQTYNLINSILNQNPTLTRSPFIKSSWCVMTKFSASTLNALSWKIKHTTSSKFSRGGMHEVHKHGICGICVFDVPYEKMDHFQVPYFLPGCSNHWSCDCLDIGCPLPISPVPFFSTWLFQQLLARWFQLHRAPGPSTQHLIKL